MGYNANKSIWTQQKDEQLHAAIQTTNEFDKYAVAVKRKKSQVVGHFLLGKSGKLAETTFYVLKTNENKDCIAVIFGTPASQGDGKGMKIPCTMQFTAEEQIIKTLKNQLETLLQIGNI